MFLSKDRVLRRLDERLAAAKPVERLTPPPKGWIRALRDALQMSGAQLGRRMGVAQQTVTAIEKSEQNGTIQLQTLRKAADALGGRLVYAIVPDVTLEEMVRTQAHQIALRALGRVSHTMKLEAQGTGDADLEARLENYIRNLKARDLWSDD